MSGIITAVVGTSLVSGYVQNQAAGEQADAIESGTSAAIAEQRAAREAAAAAAQPFSDLGENIITELLASIGLQARGDGEILSEGVASEQALRQIENAGAQIVRAREGFDPTAGNTLKNRTAQRALGEALEQQAALHEQLGIELDSDQLVLRQENLQAFVDMGPPSQNTISGVENANARFAGANEELAGIGARIEQASAAPQNALAPQPGSQPGAQQQPSSSQLQAFTPQQGGPNILFGGTQEGLEAGANQIMDFLRKEGFKDIQDSAAASGRLSSGDTLKDLNRFNTGLAATVLPQLQQQQFGQQLASGAFNQGQQAQQFGQQLSIEDFNRLQQNQLFNQDLATQGAAQSQQQQRFNQLFNILGLGANAATGQGANALQAAGNIGNLQVANAQAQGNAAINQSNAISNTLGNLVGTAGLFGGFGGNSLGNQPGILDPNQRLA